MKIRKRKYDRNITVLGMMVLLFAILTYKVYDLQITNGSSYLASVNSSSTTAMHDFAPRGNIYDANGVLLAGSKKSYMVQYIAMPGSSDTFYNTISLVNKILDDAKETQTDDFPLKINPLRFEFNSSDATTRNNMEITFKRTRGMHTDIEKKLFPGIKSADLTSQQKKQVDAALLKITPEETFEYLVNLYSMNKLITDTAYTAKDISAMTAKELLNVLLKNNTMARLREYLVVKDDLFVQGAATPVIVASKISENTSFTIQQRLSEMPGVQVIMEPVRYYPNNELGSAFIGYISKIGADSADKYTEKGYDPNTDYVGMAGIESAFESRLKGTNGESIVKLNQQGRITEVLGSMDPYPGQNIYTTIDSKVQYAAETALDNVMTELQNNPSMASDTYTANATRGAVVVTNLKNGKVLALASRPGFNPNDFSQDGGLTTALQEKYFSPDITQNGLKFIDKMGLTSKNNMTSQALLDKLFPLDKKTNVRTDPNDIFPKPLYNYATMGLFPPGSTFKPMVAVAGLESGVITANDQILDQDKFADGRGFSTTFPSDAANGWVNLKSALGVSSNPYFMTLGERIRDAFGEDKLAEYAWKFGLGIKPGSKVKSSTGIEIYEGSGQVYNSVSNKLDYQTNYLYSTMDKLLAGVCEASGSYFKKIELHDKDYDSDDVKTLKTKIKAQIQQTIITGNRDKDYAIYVDLLTKLVNADTAYKDKGVTKTDIALAAKEIIWETVDNGYSQLGTGAGMYNASIGQGSDNFTSLQLVNYFATLVNGGTRYKLSIIDKITDADGKVLKEFQPIVAEKTGISASTVSSIEAGLQAVTGDEGTAAHSFDNLPFKTGGKTGSATVKANQELEGRTAYAVYVGYAPVDDPQIAVCVVVYDGGHGSFIAPVARAVYEAYFRDTLKKDPTFALPAADSFLADMFK